MPLADLVRIGLPGVLARINTVNHVFLHDDLAILIKKHSIRKEEICAPR